LGNHGPYSVLPIGLQLSLLVTVPAGLLVMMMACFWLEMIFKEEKDLILWYKIKKINVPKIFKTD